MAMSRTALNQPVALSFDRPLALKRTVSIAQPIAVIFCHQRLRAIFSHKAASGAQKSPILTAGGFSQQSLPATALISRLLLVQHSTLIGRPIFSSTLT